MPARIPLSHVKHLGDFAAVVAEFHHAVTEWAARPADWDPCPPPVAPHPWVQVAAHVGSFELVDDAPPPPPPPSLEERKRSLVDAAKAAHAAAQAAVLPPLKRPLVELRLRQALQASWENRTLGDREAINNQRALEARLEANDLHLAQLLAAVHDLTEETIGSWSPAPFPEAPGVQPPTAAQRREQLAVEIDAELERQVKAVHPFLKRDLLEIMVRNAKAKEPEQRSAADQRAIAEGAAVEAKVEQLRLHAATLKAELHELDGAALASWKPAAFPA